jgi:hypothetical protein
MSGTPLMYAADDKAKLSLDPAAVHAYSSRSRIAW